MTTTTEDRPPERAPRLPAAPLLERIARQYDREHAGLKFVGRVTGVSTRTVRRWKVEGLTLWHADTLALRVGFLPHEVWGVDWLAALEADVVLDDDELSIDDALRARGA